MRGAAVLFAINSHTAEFYTAKIKDYALQKQKRLDLNAFWLYLPMLKSQKSQGE